MKGCGYNDSPLTLNIMFVPLAQKVETKISRTMSWQPATYYDQHTNALIRSHVNIPH